MTGGFSKIIKGDSPESGFKLESGEALEAIKRVVVTGLQRAYSVHESLGPQGTESIDTNRFRETALLVDIKAEKAVLDFLREINFPIRVISEEHGITNISENPRYLGILDGIDGSSVCKKEWGAGRYGTMFGIYNTVDPYYGEYLVGGVMEHSTRKLFVASRGEGAYVIQNGEIKQIRASGITTLDQQKTRIYVDEFHDVSRRVFAERLRGFPLSVINASCVAYVDVAAGKAEMALECTRKGNLEIAAACALIMESGGVLVDIEGRSLLDRKYLEFGQNEQLPTIAAATQDLALALIAHVKE